MSPIAANLPKLPEGYHYAPGYTYHIVVQKGGLCVARVDIDRVLDMRPPGHNHNNWTLSDKYPTIQDAVNAMVARLWLGEWT